MSTAATTISTSAVVETGARPHPIRRAAVTSGIAAAAATTAVAAVADAAGVPLAIDGEMIPLAGFAQLTLVGAVIGGLMAAAFNRFSSQPRHWFTVAAMVLTALSCIPSLAFPPDAATKIVLVATHVIAAVIIVPALARQTSR